MIVGAVEGKTEREVPVPVDSIQRLTFARKDDEERLARYLAEMALLFFLEVFD